nr:hypothetical protein [uncultured Gemmiger sp.]
MAENAAKMGAPVPSALSICLQ